MMSKTILITGATGYIGAWTVKMALEKGYTVHATVRNLKDTNKYQFLQNGSSYILNSFGPGACHRLLTNVLSKILRFTHNRLSIFLFLPI